ncbi:hypothetical protein [Paenarthrobacter sp. NPDC091669]|uniref:hypothetical protein n=1 Tax=Paenarthrobacter sp. NPDC091669 TaxID=3364384 RepID=UPI00381BC156
MSGAVPGFVPRMLVDPDVGLYRADERVFTATLDRWRAQMLARRGSAEDVDIRPDGGACGYCYHTRTRHDGPSDGS